VADDEGVSPVLGTILMIAITVVVAGVLFVISNDLSKPDDKTPAVSFIQDKGDGTVLIVKAPVEPNAVKWSAFRLEGNCDPLLNGEPLPPPPDELVKGGDLLSGCHHEEDLVIVHIETATVIYDVDF
jgi:flagellin-like protein